MPTHRAGWQVDGVLRIQCDQSLGQTEWSARFNSQALTPTQDVREPYPSPYPSVLGSPDQHRAWVVPKQLVRDGKNEVAVTMAAGEGRKRVVFVDVGIR